MTEPAARTSARRTVRVATALIAGQAALCAVVGWVTLGDTHHSARPAAPLVDPLAGAPLVIPPPSMPLPPAPPATSPSGTGKATVTSIEPAPSASSRRAPRRSSAPPVAAPPPPSPPATTGPTASSATPGPAASREAYLVPSAPPATQEPVVAGEPCDPEGAPGRTADGVALVCVAGADGVLRWQIS